jgi:hypothetical protein
MKEFTSLYSDLEQTLTMADWYRHREAEYQRLHDKKEEEEERTKKEQRKRGNV